MKKVLLLLFSLLIFSGCSLSKNMVGEYKLVEARSDDIVLKGNDLKKINMNYSVIVKNNNTAIIKTDVEEKVKYDDKFFYSIKDESDRIFYTFDGKKLVLSISDTELVFEKK